MKIRRRKSKKRYLGKKNVYEYEQLSIGLPSRFHKVVEPFLGKDLDMNVRREGDSKIVIVLKPRGNISGTRKPPIKTSNSTGQSPIFLHEKVIVPHI